MKHVIVSEQTLVYQVLCKETVMHFFATDFGATSRGLNGHHDKVHLPIRLILVNCQSIHKSFSILLRDKLKNYHYKRSLLIKIASYCFFYSTLLKKVVTLQLSVVENLGLVGTSIKEEPYVGSLRTQVHGTGRFSHIGIFLHWLLPAHWWDAMMRFLGRI